VTISLPIIMAAIHRHVLERIDVELEKAFGVALR